MNNEHYDEIGRTEDFSMISAMDDGESRTGFLCNRIGVINKQWKSFFRDSLFR